MIEVEKKFKLSEGDLDLLLSGAVFISEKEFCDVYFDDGLYSLTTNDIWLRKRGKVFELKLPVSKIRSVDTDQYEEISDESLIKKFLKLDNALSIDFSIKSRGFFPFCECRTLRRKFKKDEFVIDVDFVNFFDFSYEIAEIELVVSDKTEISNASDKIHNFAKNFGLKNERVRGKVIEYLYNKKIEHYNALVSSGVYLDK
jgi:adenylate cyclase class IV